MAEARKTFPMSTFAAYIKGEGKEAQKQNIVELVSFMTGKDIDDEFYPFASALGKAWVYEQHPELAKMTAGQVQGLGDNVSMQELPDQEKTKADEIFSTLKEYRQRIDEQNEKIQQLESELAETKGKLGETEKAMADYKGKYEALEASGKGEGEKVFIAAEEKVTDLNNQITELAGEVDKAKNSIIAILKAAPTGEGGAPAAGTGAPEAGGEPEADFGFGGDPFGDSEW
ncbi:hypothetical protein [Desulfohalovibrio reitneri]|uniref:hypothetical protein n=1 Tax=Desulfohalovibrio reitneri TaxID=1307759 RepID=UPI0004A736C1|nr:hypothetical protein [Desulfohalovibrio reitneri]